MSQGTELNEPNTLQTIIWGGLMAAKYQNKDLLAILDETVDHLHDELYIMEYKSGEELKSTQLTSDSRIKEGQE